MRDRIATRDVMNTVDGSELAVFGIAVAIATVVTRVLGFAQEAIATVVARVPGFAQVARRCKGLATEII